MAHHLHHFLISSTFIHPPLYFHVYGSVTSSTFLTFMCLSLYFSFETFCTTKQPLARDKDNVLKSNGKVSVSQLTKLYLATAK